MKHAFAATLIATLVVSAAIPALADRDHHDRGDRGYRGGYAHYDRDDRHDRDGRRASRDDRYVRYERRPPERFWRGRPVVWYRGGWGYWAPRNGLSIFVNLPL